MKEDFKRRGFLSIQSEGCATGNYNSSVSRNHDLFDKLNFNKKRKVKRCSIDKSRIKIKE